MTGGEVSVIVMFVACAVAIPIVVVGWMRDPMGRAIDEQAQRDVELEARRSCAPLAAVTVKPTPTASNVARHLTHVDGRPLRLTPVQERLVDVINDEGRAA